MEQPVAGRPPTAGTTAGGGRPPDSGDFSGDPMKMLETDLEMDMDFHGVVGGCRDELWASNSQSSILITCERGLCMAV